MTDSNKLYYKTCREQAGLTQEQAIPLLGIAEPATLSRYENGHIPVSQELVAAMIKVYRTPSLAQWHVEYTNPDLVDYLRMSDKLLTDGDAMLQLELANDSITEERAILKAIFLDGSVSQDELVAMDLSIHTLRSIASRIISAVKYLETRKGD